MFIFKFRFQKSITTIFSFLFLAFLFVPTTLAAPGDLDTSFGVGGIARSALSKTSADQGQAAALQTDGKIVVAGFGYNTSVDISLVRYNPNGSLDTSFEGDGISHVELGNGIDVVLANAMQPDGKIIVAGYSEGATGGRFFVSRYNNNGTLDATFGGGKVFTSFNTAVSEGANAV
jgi:uncharacterized delta-60 repeat protein